MRERPSLRNSFDQIEIMMTEQALSKKPSGGSSFGQSNEEKTAGSKHLPQLVEMLKTQIQNSKLYKI